MTAALLGVWSCDRKATSLVGPDRLSATLLGVGGRVCGTVAHRDRPKDSKPNDRHADYHYHPSTHSFTSIPEFKAATL